MIKKGPETQPEPAPGTGCTLCLGPNRNNAKALSRKVNRLGCPGGHHLLKERILRAAKGSEQKARRSKADTLARA